MMTLVLFPGPVNEHDAGTDVEHRIALLTDAAYQVVLRHGLTGSFIRIQLEIREAIRAVIDSGTSSAESFGTGHSGLRRLSAGMAEPA